MGFYDEETASRGAGEMNVLINTVGVVRSDAPIDVDEEACFSIHASANNGQTPASIVFTVLSTPAGRWDDGDALRMEDTFILTPEQARAMAYGMLRIADAVQAEVDSGVWRTEARQEPVYVNPPNL